MTLSSTFLLLSLGAAGGYLYAVRDDNLLSGQDPHSHDQPILRSPARDETIERAARAQNRANQIIERARRIQKTIPKVAESTQPSRNWAKDARKMELMAKETLLEDELQDILGGHYE